MRDGILLNADEVNAGFGRVKRNQQAGSELNPIGYIIRRHCIDTMLPISHACRGGQRGQNGEGAPLRGPSQGNGGALATPEQMDKNIKTRRAKETKPTSCSALVVICQTFTQS